MEKTITLDERLTRADEVAEDVARAGAVYRVVRPGSEQRMIILDEACFAGWMHAIDEMRRPELPEGLEETRLELESDAGLDLESARQALRGARPPQ